MFHLEVNQLHKSYGDTKVFEGIEFGIRKGGAGDPARPLRLRQSTLLRALAGLTPVDGGQVRVAGETSPGRPPEAGHRHGVPELCAFPNMTVWTTSPSASRFPSRAGSAASVQEALELVELTGFERRYPPSPAASASASGAGPRPGGATPDPLAG